MIKVLIIDDSAVVRSSLLRILGADPEINALDPARNGKEGVEKALVLRPDVIIMDVDMPVMNGLEATREIMARRPTPILILTTTFVKESMQVPYLALQAGAIDVLTKPVDREQGYTGSEAQKLIRMIKLVAGLSLSTRRKTPLSAIDPDRGSQFEEKLKSVRIVSIGTSTGGPKTLHQILSVLPEYFPYPVVIAQHIGKGFMEGMVNWIKKDIKIPVIIAKQGDRIRPGIIFFAPDNMNLSLDNKRSFCLTEPAVDDLYVPSINALFNSVAALFGSSSLGIILTGMGNDGAEGLLSIKRAGGRTIAQDEATSVIFGMPKAAVELGAAETVLSQSGISRILVSLSQAAGEHK